MSTFRKMAFLVSVLALSSPLFAQEACPYYWLGNLANEKTAPGTRNLVASTMQLGRRLISKQRALIGEFKRGRVPDLDNTEHIEAVKAWSKELEEKGFLQEAIWNLREAGLKKEAEKKQRHMLTMLRNIEVVEISPIGVHDGLYEITLKNGIRAFFKTVTAGNVWKTNLRAEQAALHLDELLGLNVVPTSVKRRIDVPGRGPVKGILQIAVVGDRPDEYWRSNQKVARETENRNRWARSPRVKLLDLLMLNNDRINYDTNYLVRSSGAQAALDNAYSLVSGRWQAERDMTDFEADKSLYYPGNSPHKRLMTLTKERIKKEFEPIIGDKYLLIASRIDAYQTAFREPNSRSEKFEK